jgi:hypothetical protein
MQTIDPRTDATILAQRNQKLATLFNEEERVWLVGESFNETELIWRMDVVRMGKFGQWVRQRYLYDIAKQIVYFFGESPLDDDQAAALRREGTRFPTKTERK